MSAVTEEAPAAEPQTYTVHVDGESDDYNSHMLAYFPRDVQVHAGDTVEFQWVDTGEPHTVTFGGLVDDAVAAPMSEDPDAPPAPEWEVLPVLINEETLEVPQSAGQPCFMREGEPGTDACSEEEQVAQPFDGGYSYYNSGWPEGAATFTVKIDEATPPGTYNYVCLLHVPFMAGTVEVVDSETEVETPEEAMARGEQELAAFVESLDPAVQGTQPPTAGDIIAGVFAMDPVPGADVFIPESTTIAAGESVTWTMMGPHLVAFNAPPEAAGPRVEDEDGNVGLNMAALGPAGGSPGMPPPPEGEPPAEGDAPTEESMDTTPEAAPAEEAEMPPPMVVDGGEWNGEDFYNSGLFISFPPNLFAFKLTFTEPGEYPYQCLIHPGMNGTITVQ
jgi:plastocyanin